MNFINISVLILMICCLQSCSQKNNHVPDVSDEVKENDPELPITEIINGSISYKDRIKKYGIKPVSELNKLLDDNNMFKPFTIIPSKYQFMFAKGRDFSFPTVTAERAFFKDKWMMFEKNNLKPTKLEVLNQAKIIYKLIPEVLNSREFELLGK